MIRAKEEVVQRELVAGGAAQPDRVPDVGPFHIPGAHQHGALLRLAIGFAPRRAVGRIDRTMRAEPGRGPAAGGERPPPPDPVAPLAFDRPALWARGPGPHGLRSAQNA